MESCKILYVKPTHPRNGQTIAHFCVLLLSKTNQVNYKTCILAIKALLLQVTFASFCCQLQAEINKLVPCSFYGKLGRYYGIEMQIKLSITLFILE